MKFRTTFFNIILLSLGLLAGCQTADAPQKQVSSLRLHIEVNPDVTSYSQPVPIYRAQPVFVNIEHSPFADERDVESASVIDWMDGFAIQINLDRHGKWVLENITRGNPNRRVAVCCEFDGETRWLAAPLMGRPVSNGVLAFTPDATRSDAERIVRGLNNVAAELKKKSF